MRREDPLLDPIDVEPEMNTPNTSECYGAVGWYGRPAGLDVTPLEPLGLSLLAPGATPGTALPSVGTGELVNTAHNGAFRLRGRVEKLVVELGSATA